MNAEIALVLELCKFEYPSKYKITKLLECDINFPYILGLILYNRVGGIAYYTLKKCGLLGEVNREFRNTLKSIYESNVQKNNSFLDSINEVSSMLKDVTFKYALLKGAHLSKVYPEGLRTSNDIDILINSGDISSLSEILKENGFLQGDIRNDEFKAASRSEIVSSRINRGETVPFVKKTEVPQMKFLEIDVNFSLDCKPTSNVDILNAMLDATQKPNNESFYTLNKCDFLIHLCTHLYKEATVLKYVQMGRDLSLYKFVDIYLLINRLLDEEYLKKLKKNIKAYGLERECYFAFYNTRKLFELNNKLLDSLIDYIRPKDLSFMKIIEDVSSNKLYFYKYDFIEWFFLKNRRRLLNEA